MNRFTVKAINLIIILALIGWYNGKIEQNKLQEEANKKEADWKAEKEQLEQNLSEEENEKESVWKLWEAKKQKENGEENAANATAETTALQETETEKEESDSPYKDGQYQGSAKGFGGEIVVQVSIQDGVISDIEIKSADKEDRAYLESASSIVNDMLDAQSADVDTVSGATFSSTGIREATKQALEKAMK